MFADNPLIANFYNKVTFDGVKWENYIEEIKPLLNSFIDKIIAIKNGALGGKLTGAGGGGHMLFYCEPRNQERIKETFKKINLKHVPFRFELTGPRVIKIS